MNTRIKRAAVIFVVGLWLWMAFSISLHSSWELDVAGHQTEVATQRVLLQEGRAALRSDGFKERWYLDEKRLLWLVLPLLIAVPILREVWREQCH